MTAPNRGPFPPMSTRDRRLHLALRLMRDAALTFGLLAAVPMTLAGILGAVVWLWLVVV